MMAAASEINKTCPIMVDQYTQLDNALALPDNSFQYNYTLIDISGKVIGKGIINDKNI